MDAPDSIARPRSNGAARIYKKLREEILCLKLRPGSPLDEVTLGRRFGLSRSPVREALIRLSGEGLVVILPNRSTIVTPFDLEGLPRYLDALDLMQRATTRLAASLRTAKDLSKIKMAEAAFERAVQRGSILAKIERNRDYHLAIATASHNPYFASLYSRLLDEGMRMLHIHFRFRAETEEPRAELLTGEHSAITKAIEDQDPERAEQLAHEHAELFSERFMRYLRQNLSADMLLAPSTKRALKAAS